MYRATAAVVAVLGMTARLGAVYGATYGAIYPACLSMPCECGPPATMRCCDPIVEVFDCDGLSPSSPTGEAAGTPTSQPKGEESVPAPPGDTTPAAEGSLSPTAPTAPPPNAISPPPLNTPDPTPPPVPEAASAAESAPPATPAAEASPSEATGVEEAFSEPPAGQETEPMDPFESPAAAPDPSPEAGLPAAPPAAEVEPQETPESEAEESPPETPDFEDLFGPSAASGALTEPGGWHGEATRTWCNADGDRMATARIAAVTAEGVKLLSDRGETVTLRFAELSSADLGFLRRQVEARQSQLASAKAAFERVATYGR